MLNDPQFQLVQELKFGGQFGTSLAAAGDVNGDGIHGRSRWNAQSRPKLGGAIQHRQGLRYGWQKRHRFAYAG